jgi:dihydroxyacetone kinase phosphotransfer subunit
VLISHHRKLAAGVRELADQMAGGEVAIAAVGGVQDEAGAWQLGTDALAIEQAIRQHWQPGGLLLLVDLGSAVLSAELALDLLEPDLRQRCLISNAPLVEGAVVAALEASLGRSLDQVNQAAEATCNFQKVTR